MAKHNQTKSLGPLTNFQSAPEPTPETTDERIDRLERRILQVETLLNDVMQQLDKPYTQPKSPQNEWETETGKTGENSADAVQASEADRNLKPKKNSTHARSAPATTEEQKQADTAAVIAFLHQHPDSLWHRSGSCGITAKEHCGISNRRIALATKTPIEKTGIL